MRRCEVMSEFPTKYGTKKVRQMSRRKMKLTSWLQTNEALRSTSMRATS